MTRTLFIFGLGYSAHQIAARLSAQGWHIAGTSRTSEGCQQLEENGWQAFVFDGERGNASVAEALKTASHILLSIPPGQAGDPAYLHFSDVISASPSIEWIGYLSTIGVYGDSGGAWVDEETPAEPGSERGKRRLDAEMSWQSLGSASKKAVSVFRLPGIYGPGRSAIEDLRNGRARRLVKSGQVFNRIHVDDIATSVIAAIDANMSGVFNVTDDEPAPSHEVVDYAARLLGVDAPPKIDFETADLTPMARSFYSECKRVSNSKLKRDLGVSLAFPTYREGLQAIADLH